MHSAAWLLGVIDLPFIRPIAGLPQVADAMGGSHRLASRHVETLEAEGVLREITGPARHRVYRVDEVLRAIEGQVWRVRGTAA
jgi:hypothetical protein